MFVLCSLRIGFKPLKLPIKFLCTCYLYHMIALFETPEVDLGGLMRAQHTRVLEDVPGFATPTKVALDLRTLGISEVPVGAKPGS